MFHFISPEGTVGIHIYQHDAHFGMSQTVLEKSFIGRQGNGNFLFFHFQKRGSHGISGLFRCFVHGTALGLATRQIRKYSGKNFLFSIMFKYGGIEICHHFPPFLHHRLLKIRSFIFYTIFPSPANRNLQEFDGIFTHAWAEGKDDGKQGKCRALPGWCRSISGAPARRMKSVAAPD